MTFAHAFLLLSGLFFLILFALPLLFATTGWAKAFQWREAERADPLTLYFGRCLGAVAIAITGITLRYAGSPTHQPLLLELIASSAFLLTGVHVWGAIRRTQPWTEDAEILLYGGAMLLALYARFGL